MKIQYTRSRIFATLASICVSSTYANLYQGEEASKGNQAIVENDMGSSHVEPKYADNKGSLRHRHLDGEKSSTGRIMELVDNLTDSNGDSSTPQGNDNRYLFGQPCDNNDICGSGICSDGVCVECESDDDCEGHGESLPGMIPKAFCYESACSQWKHGHPINETGYPLQYGTRNQELNWLRRHVYEGESVASLLWRFELDSQPEEAAKLFESNSTHISVPMNTMLFAGYSMHNHAIEEHETGILEILFGPNTFSIVTPNPEVGNAEKYHTLTNEGPMDDSHKQRIIAELEARDNETNQRAKDQSVTRNRLMTISNAKTRIGAATIEALQDIIQLEQLRHFITDESQETTSKLASESNEAKAALELAKTLPSLKSNNQCTHYEQQDGFGRNDTHAHFPLDTPLVFHKGTTEFIPSHYMGFNSGVVVVEYDASSNVLEFHFQASQFSRAYPYDSSSSKNGFWVSSINDDYQVESVDGRSDEYYSAHDYGIALNLMVQAYTSIPIDYSFFDHSTTGTCDQDTLDQMSGLWTEVSVEVDPSKNMLEHVGDKIDLMTLVDKGMSCGSSYLRVDAHEDLVGNDWLESMVWAHFILEQDSEFRENMCTATFWDGWNQFYKEQKSERSRVKDSKKESDDMDTKNDNEGTTFKAVPEESDEMNINNGSEGTTFKAVPAIFLFSLWYFLDM